MKKAIAAIGILLSLLAAFGCRNVETDYPAAIMVNGQIYLKSASEVIGEADEIAIIGYTTSYTDTYPEKDGETNFSRKTGLPYAAVEEGIAILVDGEWYICYPHTSK